ncbi:hypothetical protein THAOC_01914, partial [Thalassiosira oceanica]
MKFSLTLIAAAVLLGSTSADTTYYFNTELAADPIAVPQVKDPSPRVRR